MSQLDQEQAAIARRQKIAEQLMAQGSEPLQTTQTAGGYVVPVSPLAGIAKVAQQLSGAYISKKAEQRQDDLTQKKADIVKALFSGSEPPTLSAVANSGIATPDVMMKMGSDLAAAKAAHSDKMDERKFTFESTATQRQSDQQARAQEAQLVREQTFAQQEQMAKLAASLRPEPQGRQDALVQVMGENGPVYLPSSQAAGKQPFNAQLAKTDATLDAAAQGKETVSNVVANLHDLYNTLDENGGITNPDKSGASNILAGSSSSEIGQMTGKILGTKNQSTRNEILQARPLLLQQIMKATGMSAKQMDSNTELKLWLSTATDPTLDVKANKAALDSIESMYGVGSTGKTNNANQPAQAADEQGANDPDYQAYLRSHKK